MDDLELTRRVGAMLGHTLREVGVTLDLAPVVDVRTSTDNMVLLGRTFGGDAALVARHAPAMVEGLLAAGVLACAKHFPGHGDTREDSHEVLPRVPHDRARLDAVELVPFRSVLSTVPAVMLAHVIYEGVDRQRPASLSPAHARALLREHLGFRGVAVSDDLEMAPIRTGLGVPSAAVQALVAGCDLVLTAHTPHHAVDAIQALALRADRDPAFRERLREASGRVGAMRSTLLQRVPPNPYREPPEALLREVASRVRGLRERHYRDPTRR